MYSLKGQSRARIARCLKTKVGWRRCDPIGTGIQVSAIPVYFCATIVILMNTIYIFICIYLYIIYIYVFVWVPTPEDNKSLERRRSQLWAARCRGTKTSAKPHAKPITAEPTQLALVFYIIYTIQLECKRRRNGNC